MFVKIDSIDCESFLQLCTTITREHSAEPAATRAPGDPARMDVGTEFGDHEGRLALLLVRLDVGNTQLVQRR